MNYELCIEKDIIMDLRSYLNELEIELTDKKGGLFGKKVDIDRCLDIINDMYGVIPSAVNEANVVLNKKAEIISGAQSLAKQTIGEAEIRAEQIISDSEITKRAQTEASRILETAQMQSDTLLHKTTEHLEAMFTDIEQYLVSNLNMIRNNREELREALTLRKE